MSQRSVLSAPASRANRFVLRSSCSGERRLNSMSSSSSLASAIKCCFRERNSSIYTSLYPMCDSLGRSITNQAVQVQRGTAQVEIEKHADRVRQHFADHAMLKVPQIAYPNAGDGEPFRQLRADRLNALAPARRSFEQRLRVRGWCHPGTDGRNDRDVMASLQQVLPKGINEAFVGGDEPREALDQGVQVINVVGPCSEQRAMGNHPAAGDPQAQLEAVIVELLGRTVPVVGLQGKAFIPPSAPRVRADRHGQRVNGLDRVGRLPAEMRQALLERSFNLPEVGRLPDK